MHSMRSRRVERAAWSTVKYGLALAGAFERCGHRLEHRSQFARRERHECDAGAIGVARATRTVSITVEGGSIGTLEAVVLADDPFLHDAMSSLGVPGKESKSDDPPTLSPLRMCVGLGTNVIRG